tara:strand:+ start:1487 stop:2242 length:756 start_codon:yes stop_codon:yes gene_type:complete
MSKCFKSPVSVATTSGERTAYKRQASKFKTTANSHKQTAAEVKGYQNYDNNYNINNCKSLVSARSYDDLLDITKGKHYVNPLLDGSSMANYQSWAGNFIKIDNTGNDYVFVGTNNTNNSGNNNDNYPNINEIDNNVLPIPTDVVVWDSTSTIQRFFIDPRVNTDSSNNIIYTRCGNLYPYPIIFDASYTKIKCRDSQIYWDAVTKGEKLNGIMYPTKINFSSQETNLNNTIAQQYAPLPNNSVDQLNRWCN